MTPLVRIGTIDKKHSTSKNIEDAVNWLLACLDSGPHLVRDIKKSAEAEGIPQRILLRAAGLLPLIRRPSSLRGPWIWRLPDADELVRIRYECPIMRCSRSFEGWIEFGPSRALFSAGMIHYMTRGSVQRVRPNRDTERLLLLAPCPAWA